MSPSLSQDGGFSEGGFPEGAMPGGMRQSRSAGEMHIDEPIAPLVEMQRFLENMLMDFGRFNVQSFAEGPFVDPESLIREIQQAPISNETQARFGYLQKIGFYPLFETNQALCLAMSAETPNGDPRTADDLALLVQDDLMPKLTGYPEDVGIVLFALTRADFEEFVELSRDKGRRDQALAGLSLEASARKVFHQIVHIAISEKSSDIHFEPTNRDAGDYRVRTRVDGVLKERHIVPAQLATQLIAVIKNEAQMKIDESRLPQDGRIFFTREDVAADPLLKDMNMRASVIPAVGGNKAVLRLFKKASGNQFNLEQLGFQENILTGLNELITNPNGLILVSGPTGSGKTTTLYSMLNRLKESDEDNILTIEDPVEVQIPGITQVQVNTAIDFTFAAALRAFLRQDPDIILVGEVRDAETAEIALQTALTGHLVFATVHTNDSFGVLGRLSNLGRSPSEIQDTVRGVFSQRLVRELCVECKEDYDAKDQLNALIGDRVFTEPVNLKRAGVGQHAAHCKCCDGAGFVGRIVIPELWRIGPREQAMILEGVTKPGDFLKAAKEQGMATLLDNALGRVREGRTSIQECISRVFSIAELRARSEDVIRILRQS